MVLDSPTSATAPLSQGLLDAAQALQKVRLGQSLTPALEALPDSRRSAAHALSFLTLRHWGLAQTLRQHLVSREPAAPVPTLLELALVLLAYPDSHRHAAHTVVNQTVEAAASAGGSRGLVNAVLRRFLRERDTLMPQTLAQPLAKHNLPAWWLTALKKSWPQEWADIASAARQPAPLVLRINPRRASLESVQHAMTDAGHRAIACGPQSLWLPEPASVPQLPGYSQGEWSVQDLGAQRSATALAPRDGERVLDACAAPGGKSAHLLELADIELTALDIDSLRLRRVQQNLQRLGHQAHALIAADALAWAQTQPAGCFDAVLADVPCSASGILRRHPDIVWLRRANDIAALAQTQAQLIQALWRLVRPGGRLLYVTCSILPAEGEAQIQRFVSAHPEARRVPGLGQRLPRPMSPQSPGEDGFFHALLHKPS